MVFFAFTVPKSFAFRLFVCAQPSCPTHLIHHLPPKPPPLSVSLSLSLPPIAQMKSLEASGLTRAQAEELTTTLTQVLCLNRERISEGFVAKSALEKVILEHEARVAALRSEVTKGQELHLASLARDTERLTASLDRVRSEIRTEADKLTAATRLDLNLEKGRMRDELQALRDKAAELEIKIDKETSALKAMLESTKSEMVRYSLGLLLSASAVGATIFRLFSSK